MSRNILTLVLLTLATAVHANPPGLRPPAGGPLAGGLRPLGWALRPAGLPLWPATNVPAFVRLGFARTASVARPASARPTGSGSGTQYRSMTFCVIRCTWGSSTRPCAQSVVPALNI